eukprot:tig00001234_g7750.t1
MSGVAGGDGALGTGRGVRALAAHTLATALQHNERVQRAAVELKLAVLALSGPPAPPAPRPRRRADRSRAQTCGRCAGAFLAYALCGEKAAYALRLIDAEAVAPLALLLRRDDDPTSARRPAAPPRAQPSRLPLRTRNSPGARLRRALP